MKSCKGKQSVTNLNKEIPLICCFNFCTFVQWAASIKLLIMFVLLKKNLVLIRFISFYHFGMEFTSLCMSVLT